MKKALMIGVFLAFAASAHAQAGMYGSLNSTPGLSASPGLNETGGINSTGNGNPSGIPHTASPSTTNVSDTNPGEFIPSHFEGYNDAVSDGKALANRKPMTVRERQPTRMLLFFKNLRRCDSALSSLRRS